MLYLWFSTGIAFSLFCFCSLTVISPQKHFQLTGSVLLWTCHPLILPSIILTKITVPYLFIDQVQSTAATCLEMNQDLQAALQPVLVCLAQAHCSRWCLAPSAVSAGDSGRNLASAFNAKEASSFCIRVHIQLLKLHLLEISIQLFCSI